MVAVVEAARIPNRMKRRRQRRILAAGDRTQYLGTENGRPKAQDVESENEKPTG